MHSTNLGTITGAGLRRARLYGFAGYAVILCLLTMGGIFFNCFSDQLEADYGVTLSASVMGERP